VPLVLRRQAPLEAALADHEGHVDITWRSFELDPTAPAERPEGGAEHLAAKYGTSGRAGAGHGAQMTDVAAGEGLEFRFDRLRPGSTFDAHRVVHLAGRPLAARTR
jgi:predicted DsbA family dithiol-disulfide isomerase